MGIGFWIILGIVIVLTSPFLFILLVIILAGIIHLIDKFLSLFQWRKK